jgi:predicted enzyme related to lactoylglutathione lyase
MFKYLEVATIYVSDQDRARDFYVDKLGWRLHGETPMPGGMRWIGVQPEGSQTSFSLMKPRNEEERIGVHTGFVFATNDLEAAYKELTERGVRFIQPPTFQGWGTYSEFEDPDGNRIGLSQVSNVERD